MTKTRARRDDLKKGARNDTFGISWATAVGREH